MVQTIEITTPDDWHLHLRDGAAMVSVLPHTTRQFARAIIMPNLVPPVTAVPQAKAYRERILAARPSGAKFEPLMTLYLTDNTSAATIREASASGFIHAMKYYPAGATTNSDAGVTNLERTFPALEAMTALGMPLLLHGEVTTQGVDIFDREAVFLDTELGRIRRHFPKLRVVIEHITTKEAVQYVRAAPANVGATITAHHLLYNRNAIFQGGVRPHYYCLPILKREEDRLALVQAATSGDPHFFLGTDSAPHARGSKECACGHAGVYASHAAIELYAEAFDAVGALDRLETFASFHGPDFYHLPRNQSRLRLERAKWQAPATFSFGTTEIVPLRAGEVLQWRCLAP
ncbi:MAG: dihydroorotase [Betaproteobacteria bacterium]|nr:dihydroorotase [Betaproteobacteria bacterium]